jgi:hypothetical protein
VLPIVQGGETKKVTAKAISELGGAVSIGQVAFGTAAGVIGGDSGLTWDNVNKRLGVGTSVPSRRLDVRTGVFNSVIAQFTGANDGRGLLISTFMRGSNDDSVNYNTPFSGDQSWSTNSIERMRIDSFGRFGIGTTSPTARLHVQAQGALSTDIAFLVRNSADAANLFQVKGNGTLNAANLPTSATGLVAGDFWNDAGTLKIV